ncbi:hypothetical protein PMAYCL1PPCAC_23736 [Pristionchus mayeri]|uniref:TrmE-type G domain-containing protein n=1 Tax=Pristionchus mayeri TaxID=1317129 RepID=A0AAN5CYT3_9BILA|nr:hypothetical protein PMAYCL1PPCAC_23736 [Pristionchus mayeri]
MSTIFALSSGALPAALAVFRISGPRSKEALLQMSKKKIWKPRYMHYTKIYDIRGEMFDSAMAVYLPGPRTFTGEDTAEVFLHGSTAIVDRMNETLSSLPGLRHASAGEFTKRALVNGKLNVHEMNALGALLQSTTPRQLEQATRALSDGDWLHRRITLIRAKLAVFADFGEDVQSDPKEIRKDIEDLLIEIKEKRRKGIGGERVRKGMRIVMVGKPNAGKSSLFNRLCGIERAIVSSVPGTTRDSLDINRVIGGINVTIVDTAGIRDSLDMNPIEKDGIKRTFKLMNEADLILAVIDSSSEDRDILSLIPPHIPRIEIFNKADLIPNIPPTGQFPVKMYTIATAPTGCDSLEKKLEETILELCPHNSELTLSAGIAEVEKLVEECLSHDDIGLVNEILQMASEAWGKSETNEELLNNILKNFCIGK